MEIYQLRTLVTVAQERHLTRAAERLHLSQPAVSGHIKELERQLGVILFDRRTEGMLLTESGTELLRAAEKVLQAAGEMISTAQCLSGRISGRLSLGIIFDQKLARLGELTDRLLSAHPSLRFQIQHRNSTSAIAGIRSRELDASFYIGDEVPSDMSSIRLQSVDFCMASAPAWAARLEGADWASIANMPWVTTPRGTSLFRLTASLLRRHGFELKMVVEADRESVIESLVQRGVGLGLIRRALIADAIATGRLIEWKKGRVKPALQIVFSRARADDTLIRALLDAASSIWNDRSTHP